MERDVKLAPRPGTGRAPSDSNRSTVKSAEGQAAKKARQRLEGVAVGTVAKPFTKYPQLDWSTIENDVELISEFAGRISQSQMGTNGFYSTTMYVPKAYAHAVLEAALAQEGGMMYIRMYKVPITPFLQKMYDDGQELSLVELATIGQLPKPEGDNDASSTP